MSKASCYHCGLPIPADVDLAVTINDVPQAMCCLGCQAVAQSIVDNGLADYYRSRDALPDRLAEIGGYLPFGAGIDVIGGYVKKYAVRPDPARMTAYGVGLNEVVEAVEHANTVAGAGYISRGGEAFVVRADARVRSAEDLAAAPIKNHNGLVVRVSDVATVEIGQAARLGAAQQHGEEVVIGTALMLAGENSRTVAHAVGQRLDQIQASLPPPAPTSTRSMTGVRTG